MEGSRGCGVLFVLSFSQSLAHYCYKHFSKQIAKGWDISRKRFSSRHAVWCLLHFLKLSFFYQLTNSFFAYQRIPHRKQQEHLLVFAVHMQAIGKYSRCWTVVSVRAEFRVFIHDKNYLIANKSICIQRVMKNWDRYTII